jgi:hypothetical protein
MGESIMRKSTTGRIAPEARFASARRAQPVASPIPADEEVNPRLSRVGIDASGFLLYSHPIGSLVAYTFLQDRFPMPHPGKAYFTIGLRVAVDAWGWLFARSILISHTRLVSCHGAPGLALGTWVYAYDARRALATYSGTRPLAVPQAVSC